MDPLLKKRKSDDVNGTTDLIQNDVGQSLTTQDARKILESFTKEQLLDVLQTVVVRDVAVLDSVRSIADFDPAQRKLFIRGIGWETTTEKLKSIFSVFGELEEAIVITDKNTGKSKGYGFVTFKHVDGAVLALKQPSKKIDGRITVAQLAAARDSLTVDVSMRKIYVGNVPFEISSERLLSHFSSYGEIEEGPLGFDKQTGKQKGFAFFVYKSEEGARNSLVDPVKNIDGHQVMCKMATDGKKGKPGGGGVGDATPPIGSMPGSMNSGYGLPGGRSSFSAFSGVPPLPSHQNPHLNASAHSGIGSGPGYANQGPPAYGTGGYGTGGYGTGAFSGGSHYAGGGAGAPDYPGPNNLGTSMNRLPPTQGGYGDGGNYGQSSAYPSQPNLPPAGPRGPHGGMYHGGPPYY
uniref:UBP1-associated protein 2C n=1 Tax=Erigeron canadensis TaxID=72917 RepID=UPI001CB99979|nr:UBP1-associated protein 2C [Erigeron canadensis]XP_043622009.1 UBP1-associated protein 2C [Erigeron canadensis]